MDRAHASWPWWRRLLAGVGLVVLIGVVAKVVSVFRELTGGSSVMGPSRVEPLPPVDSTDGPLPVPDSMYGRSGALRLRTLTRSEALALPGFYERHGEAALRTPAVYQVSGRGDSTFAYVVLRAFGEKRGEHLNGYRLGRWPAERWLMARNYFNPDGFVEVTPEMTALPLSAHLTLGAFLTHDQESVWPKYLVLEEKLIDKIELVLQDLETQGIPARAVVVLSGFRAPYYNERGMGEGMARASRHQYGDAADIIVDSDGNGRMDDLNRDGRVDLRDTQPIQTAIERVETRFPEYAGGLGRYSAMGPRGPFTHIDVRGTSARWESR
jgi:hypothetical protein